MSLNDPHWGRSSDEEKKNDRGDNEQRSDGVGEDGEEQNARQNPNAQDDRNPADSSADGSRRTSRDAREDDEQRDRRSLGLLSDDDLENLWSNFQQAANKIMGRQGRSNQEDLRSRLKSRDDFSRDDEPNDAAPRQKGDDYPDDGGTHGGQKRQGLFAELDRLRNQFPMMPRPVTNSPGICSVSVSSSAVKAVPATAAMAVAATAAVSSGAAEAHAPAAFQFPCSRSVPLLAGA